MSNNTAPIQVPRQLVKNFVATATGDQLLEALRAILGNLRLRAVAFDQVRPYVRILMDEVAHRADSYLDLENLKEELWEDVRSNILTYQQIESQLSHLERVICERKLADLFGGKDSATG